MAIREKIKLTERLADISFVFYLLGCLFLSLIGLRNVPSVIELLLLSLILLAFVAAIDGLRFPGTLYAFYGLSVSIYSLCVNGLTWIAAFHLIFCLALLIRFEYGTQPYLFTRWNFKQRYGPWALVAGASEGLGQAYSEQVAAKGLNVVLVARNLESLKNTAKLIEERYRVQTKILQKDLSNETHLQDIINETKDLEIGLLIYNACASYLGEYFKESLESKIRIIGK